MEQKGDDTNLKIEETEDHIPAIIGQRTEQMAHKGETIEKISNPVIQFYTTPCHSKDVKEDAVYTMESPSPKYETDWTEESLSPKYETDWVGEDDNIKQTEESLSPKYETDWVGEDDNIKQTEESLSPKYETDWLGEDDDIRQREESPSPNYKPDTICEDDENGRKIPTNSHCFNEHIRDCDKKINPSKVNAGKPKETSRLITRHKLHLLVQSMVKENSRLNLDKKRSTSRQEYILEENINVNEDSQGILTYDQVRQTQTKHEKEENKDQKQFINRNSPKNSSFRNSDQKQLSQSELELLSNIIDRLTPNS
ncbi:Hypothetical predicted protein, partial [Mytilus galloprovincialis]